LVIERGNGFTKTYLLV
jgi:hypothetical protein